MSCTPTPTATQYATVTTGSPSTSFSQSGADTRVQLSTLVQQSCIASATIGGSSVGCISTVDVSQLQTIASGGQAVQVPIVVTVPVTETTPTRTLFAPCSDGESVSPQTSSQSSSTYIPVPVTTSILVQSTPPPTTVVTASSTTLADGSVLATVVTVMTTLPPTAVYVPTSVISPSLQSTGSSQGSGTNVAPIVGGVLGGFIGLVAIVGSLWWLCRKRRSWDDIFEKDEELPNDDDWSPAVRPRRERDSRRPNSSAEPRPYQYGLVGQVVPPAAAGDTLRSSRYGSVSELSATHSRHTSFSATPLLQGTHTGTSRPSTAGSRFTLQTQPGPIVQSPIGSTMTEPRSLSMISQSNSIRPLPDGRSSPALLGAWTPNMDDLAILEPQNRTGSPVSSTERRVLQIVNDGPPSPTESAVPGGRRTSSGQSSNVIIHTDGGPVLEGSYADPPAYSR